MTRTEDNEQVLQRREKLAALKETGDAYPNDFRRDTSSADVLNAHADVDAATLESQQIEIGRAHV